MASVGCNTKLLLLAVSASVTITTIDDISIVVHLVHMSSKRHTRGIPPGVDALIAQVVFPRLTEARELVVDRRTPRAGERRQAPREPPGMMPRGLRSG